VQYRKPVSVTDRLRQHTKVLIQAFSIQHYSERSNPGYCSNLARQYADTPIGLVLHFQKWPVTPIHPPMSGITSRSSYCPTPCNIALSNFSPFDCIHPLLRSSTPCHKFQFTSTAPPSSATIKSNTIIQPNAIASQGQQQLGRVTITTRTTTTKTTTTTTPPPPRRPRPRPQRPRQPQ
jgi:hypothetical protein